MLGFGPISGAPLSDLGSPSVLSVTPGGIKGAQKFGAPLFSLSANPLGIPSREKFGAAAISLNLNPAGIPGKQKFGAQSLSLSVTPAGIKSAEKFGAASSLDVYNLFPAGIGSRGGFGLATFQGTITPTPFCRVFPIYPKRNHIIRQTPQETLDWAIDWASECFGADSIVSSAWSITPGGISLTSESFSKTQTVVWLSGGAPDIQYYLTNTIITALGRTMQETIPVFILSPQEKIL